jgi:hypothetical protein
LPRERFAKDREYFISPANPIRPRRIDLGRRQVGPVYDLRHQALEDLVIAAVDIK